VDDLVENVFSELEKTGEQDTLVVFLSDNGFLWGEHGLTAKSLQYTESIEVPYFVRYAPYTVPGATDPRLVANIDLAPTALHAAGLSRDRAPALDGISLLDLFQDATRQRSRLLTESYNGADHPADDSVSNPLPRFYDPYRNWASTRTSSYQYVESYDEDGITIKGREYYNLVSDPLQLNNLFDDGIAGNEPPIAPLHDQLMRDRLCKGAECPAAPDQGAGPLVDLEAPWAAMAKPTPGTNKYVCCRTWLEAAGADNFGVTGMRFRVDGALIAGDEATRLPYGQVWDTASASQSQQVVQRTVEAVPHDARPNFGASVPITVNVDKGLDVQIEDPDMPFEDESLYATIQKAEPGDTITYYFGRPISPSIFGEPGWSGVKPTCPKTTEPGTRPPGCVTVGLKGDIAADPDDTDSIKIYRSDAASDESTLVTELGTIDMGRENYFGTNVYKRSPMELLTLPNGTSALRITLNEGSAGSPNQFGLGTMLWRTPPASSFCGSCEIWESLDGTDPSEDREF
jgi:hypothetical protein